MRGGTLRHVIVLERLPDPPTRDSIGGVVDAWAPWASGVRAAVEPLTGRELFAAQQRWSEVTHRVALRYRAGVQASMRVKLGARVLKILAVLSVGERNRELHLMCSEAQA